MPDDPHPSAANLSDMYHDIAKVQRKLAEHQELIRPWRRRNFSPTQIEVVERLERDGGTLRRFKGGYWATENTPRNTNGIPDWSVDIRTVRAMEKRRLLVRTGVFTQEWRDERRLVEGAALQSRVVSGDDDKGSQGNQGSGGGS